MIRTTLEQLAAGRDLTRKEAFSTMAAVMDGELTPAQIAGLLVALRTKGETAEEIAGFAEAMRERVVPVTPTRTSVIDVVGTGGDGANTFNISTAAAIVAAAAGAAVAKHGNRAASSACGAADLLEALGIELAQAPGADRPFHRRARLRLHVREGAPSGHALRRAGEAGARDPNGLQPPRPTLEPCRRARRRLRRCRSRSCADLRRGARRPWRAAGRSSCTETAAWTSCRPEARASSSR